MKKTLKCFVIMPFKKKFDHVYSVYRKSCSNRNVLCERADDPPGTGSIDQRLLQGILSADFLIADLSECNANVFYELGVAHCKGIPSIHAFEGSPSDVPFDIKKDTIIGYRINSTGLEKLGRKVDKAIEQFVEQDLHFPNPFQNAFRLFEPHIICGVGQSKSRYDYQELLQSGPEIVKVVDPNMKHWLSDREFIRAMRKFLKRRKTRNVTFILSTVPPLAAMEEEGKVLGRGPIHLEECLNSIAELSKGLSEQGRKKLSVFQHPAAFTLTAFFCDPDDKKRGMVVFNPRWGNDVIWAKRLFCVVRRCEHEELFRVLYDPVQSFEYDGEKA